MKRIAHVLSILALLMCSRAMAALSIAEADTYTSTPYTMTTSCNVGDELVVFNVAAGGYPTVTSNVTTGNFNLPAPLQIQATYVGPNFYISVSYATCTSTGIPTFSGIVGGYVQVYRITGFIGTATLDTESSWAQVSSGTSISNSITSGHADLLLALTSTDNFNYASTPVGWTDSGSGAAGYVTTGYYVAQSSAGAQSLSGTLGSASNLANIIVGFYDASGGGSCTHDGITSAGALAVPNGTSGSYQGKSGAFVTPDCSTVNYKQPTVGNFGVN